MTAYSLLQHHLLTQFLNPYDPYALLYDLHTQQRFSDYSAYKEVFKHVSRAILLQI